MSSAQQVHAPPTRQGASPRPGTVGETAVPTRNEVHLVGRVSGDPDERELPSGDRLVVWRLVVDRPPPARPLPAGVRVATVDTLDCVARAAGARRTARGFRSGDVVEVTGALRRRFFRSGAGAASRTEVEVGAVRRLRRAERQT